VLYEMLTGKEAFKGESVSDTLASVLKEEPNWDALPAATPSAIRKLVRRCLNKDRKQRLQAIGEARITIEEVLSGASQESETPAAASRPRWPWLAAAAALVLAVAAGAAWVLRPKPDQPMLQMEINPPEGAKLVPTQAPFALSADGRRIAFLAIGKDGKRILWLRSIDSSAAAALAGTENADAPFWSPDGRWVGFSANSKLQKVNVVAGGQPLQRVFAAGGTPAPVLSLDAAREETYQGGPVFLPDGRHLRGQLLARPFDLDKLEFTGQPAVIADAVRGGRSWSASANGLLAFRHFYPALNQLTWVSCDGHSMSAVGDPGPLFTPRISPDQKTIAFSRVSDQNRGIWTFDLTRNTPTRLGAMLWFRRRRA
jgi:eukaryotic-like serine/threonine-protein kinase